jgi:hypothetical protein
MWSCRLILSSVLVLLSISASVSAQQYSGPDSIAPAYYLKDYGLRFEGKIGERFVNLKIMPGKIAQLGGLYYSRDLRDHLIAGEITGPRELRLVELDSLNNALATLRLRFNEYDTLTTLRGHKLQGEVLTGTYEIGTHSEPVRLIKNGYVREKESASVAAHKRAAETRIQSFVDAVIKGDRKRVTRAMRYPIHVNGFYSGKPHPSRRTYIRSKRELLRLYPKIFNDLFKEWIMTDLPRDLPRLPTDRTRDVTGIMMAAGTVWFDHDGYVMAINLPTASPLSLY